jgi:hypothetical protein
VPTISHTKDMKTAGKFKLTNESSCTLEAMNFCEDSVVGGGQGGCR